MLQMTLRDTSFRLVPVTTYKQLHTHKQHSVITWNYIWSRHEVLQCVLYVRTELTVAHSVAFSKIAASSIFKLSDFKTNASASSDNSLKPLLLNTS